MLSRAPNAIRLTTNLRSIEIGREGAHLILQHRDIADMVRLALFVLSRDRLGANDLAGTRIH